MTDLSVLSRLPIIDAHVHHWNLFADMANVRKFLDRIHWKLVPDSMKIIVPVNENSEEAEQGGV